MQLNINFVYIPIIKFQYKFKFIVECFPFDSKYAPLNTQNIEQITPLKIMYSKCEINYPI